MHKYNYVVACFPEGRKDSSPTWWGSYEAGSHAEAVQKWYESNTTGPHCKYNAITRYFQDHDSIKVIVGHRYSESELYQSRTHIDILSAKFMTVEKPKPVLPPGPTVTPHIVV